MTDCNAEILSAFRSLVHAYRDAQKALDDGPASELLLRLLPESKSTLKSRIDRFVLKHHPYTATLLVRHFVEDHINCQLNRISKAFLHLDVDSYAPNRTPPFDYEGKMINKWLEHLQRPVTVKRLLGISIPGVVMSGAAYLWRHDGLSQHGLVMLKKVVTDKTTVFMALTALSMGVGLLMEFMLLPLIYAFMRKRTIFKLCSVYSKEDKLFDVLKRQQTKLKKKREFPLDLGLSSVRFFPLAAFFSFLLLSVWEELRFQNEMALIFRRLPDTAKHFPPGFLPPHVAWVFDGPFWVCGLDVVLLSWIIGSFLLAWRARVMAKQL